MTIPAYHVLYYINWMRLFPIIGMYGDFFYSHNNRLLLKQTVVFLIRRDNIRRQIWVCTVCIHAHAYIPRVCMVKMCVCVWVHACIHVCACLCACVCPFSMCVYVYVRDYSYVLLLTSNVGVHAFACTPIDQHIC